MSIEVGVVVKLREEGPYFKELLDFGLDLCQLDSWDPALWTDERADEVLEEYRGNGVRVNAFWAGWSGPAVWDFETGPSVLGLVLPGYRKQRVEELKRAGDFAKRLELPAVITHLGFIPMNPKDELFTGLVNATRDVAKHLEKLGIEFWFETGQETPVAMLRVIEAVGTKNLGVNLDPANLVMYGMANPVDSLQLFGKYVRQVHAKDGIYPTDPMELGNEVKIGTGQVNFPEFIRRLKEIGFDGQIIIEREIAGEQQRRDIADAVPYLRELIAG